MRIVQTTGLITALWAATAAAETDHSPYAGLEQRDIAALSETDISDLEAGRGWGLALPAELNGYPGPTHILELAKELELTPGQHSRMTEIFENMRAEAKTAGSKLIAAERALDQAFAEGAINETDLRKLVDATEDARSDLRYVHLSRHLMTVNILSDTQVERYNVLRGYADDPCASVPEGHDEAMWRRHNGCVDPQNGKQRAIPNP